MRFQFLFKIIPFLLNLIVQFSEVNAQGNTSEMDSLIKVLEKPNLTDSTKQEALIVLTKQMSAIVHPDTPKYLAQLKKLSEERNSERGFAFYYLNKAAYHYLTQELKEALIEVKQANQLARKLQTDTLLIDVHNVQGIIYLDLQLWDRSLVFFQQSLRLIERIKDKKKRT